VLRLARPREQTAHGIEEMSRLEGCIAAALAAGDDSRFANPGERFVASTGNDLLENVLTLPAGSK